MTNTYLHFSKQYADQSIYETSYRPHVRQPIQRHVVLCDATNGAIHYAHEVSQDKPNEKFDFPDVIVTGPFNTEKLIYLQYTTGDAGDVRHQMERKSLTEQERKNVLQAQQRLRNLGVQPRSGGLEPKP
jgi:hypothetical protein